VEIDPVVTRVAREYFGLEPEEADIYHVDARQYLLRTDKKYDLIVLDAFGSGSIPFHLVTTEAFALVKAHLKPGGRLAINMESVGWRSKLAQAFTRTLDEQFAHVTVLPLAEPPNELGNLVFFASDDALEFDEDLLVRPALVIDDHYAHWLALSRMHAWDNRFHHDIAGVSVITDDRNPADLWSEEVNLAARRDLHADPRWNRIDW